MSGRHVLIVDDELIMREAVQLILDDQSYDTVTAANGVDGLNRLRQRAFDLMIVDLMLPDINGLEFIA
ncbi:MAG: response regulator [Acidobacteria bacterium]|nr:response regulator [Acidobacteriota bacterium]MBI3656872.1 response regulator [Acidobacteriota bacterium]